MDKIVNMLQKLAIFEKEPQKIGLTQFKNETTQESKTKKTKQEKNIKLSDLMRGKAIK